MFSYKRSFVSWPLACAIGAFGSAEAEFWGGSVEFETRGGRNISFPLPRMSRALRSHPQKRPLCRLQGLL